MAIATVFGWPNGIQIVLAIALAFVFGYALTIQPVLRAGVPFRKATGVALASDTVSITASRTRLPPAIPTLPRRRARSSSRRFIGLHAHAELSLNRAPPSATTHCLTGGATGEVIGTENQTLGSDPYGVRPRTARP